MAYFAPVELSHAFCSYCGKRPTGRAQGTSRVCERCGLGMVLRAPSGAAPRSRDPFLIIDDNLVVRAISHSAERVLGVEEPDGVDVFLDEFLQPADHSIDRLDLALLVQLTVAGSPPSDKLDLRAVGRPRRRFAARLTSCGPPPAAVLVLASAANLANRAASNGATRGRAGNQEALARA